MGYHGGEITNRIFEVCDWSWSGHGTAPASVTLAAKVEGHPLDFLDRDSYYPALFLNTVAWPRYEHYPHLTVETFAGNIYVVDTVPAGAYMFEAVRELMNNVITNILAAKETDEPAYNLTHKLELDYVEDVKCMAVENDNDVAALLRSLGLDYVCSMASIEVQARGAR